MKRALALSVVPLFGEGFLAATAAPIYEESVGARKSFSSKRTFGLRHAPLFEQGFLAPEIASFYEKGFRC